MSQPGQKPPRVIDWMGGPFYLPLLGGEPETCGMRSGRVELAAGEEIGEHSTGDHEEVLVVIQGTGQAHVEGHQPLAIHGGQEVYIPPHSKHNVRNTAEETLRYVYVVAPVRTGQPP